MNFGAPWDSLKISSLQIPDALLDILKGQFGFTNMTPVQECVIPLFCQHKDVAAQAETGSGKTFAYIVPIVVALSEKESEPLAITDQKAIKFNLPHQTIHSLIIAPTQILAQQIYDVLIQVVSADHVLLLIGGTNTIIDSHGNNSSKQPIVVATPGRLRYYLADGLISLKNLEVLIIDEADQVIMSKDFPYIRANLPPQRRTGLFSATFDSISESDLSLLMRNPHIVKLYNTTKEKDVYIVPQNLVMWYKVVPYEQKLYMLLRHINALRLQHQASSPKKLIVFFMTCAMSQYMSFVLTHIFNLLQEEAPGIYCFNGKQSQETKIKNYNSFLTDTKFSVLFTTDISARGLDIDDIGHVLQFDPPKLIATYTHRAGRTARCYRSGDAGIFLSPEETGIVQLLRTRGIPLHEILTEHEKLLFDSEMSENTNAEFLKLLQPPVNTQGNLLLSSDEFNAIRASIKELTQKSKKLSRALTINQQRMNLAAESTIGSNQSIQKMKTIMHTTIKIPLEEVSSQLSDLLEKEKIQSRARNYMYNHSLTEFLRELQATKREIFESCQRAFETWLSGYNENEAKIIFNIEKLPIGEFAVSLGLLKLPIHDILKRKHVNFISVDVDINSIAYSDSKREENRLTQMSLSAKKRELRMEINRKKKEQKSEEHSNKITDIIRENIAKQSYSHGNRVSSQFLGESRLLGLLKSGKITEEEFDEMIDDLALSGGRMSKNSAKIRKWRR